MSELTCYPGLGNWHAIVDADRIIQIVPAAEARAVLEGRRWLAGPWCMGLGNVASLFILIGSNEKADIRLCGAIDGCRPNSVLKQPMIFGNTALPSISFHHGRP